LQKHKDSIAETGEKVNVDNQPGDPSKPSSEFPASGLHNRFVTSDCSHNALIAVSERTSIFSFEIPLNRFGNIFSLLDRNGGKLRQRPVVLGMQVCQIACVFGQ